MKKICTFLLLFTLILGLALSAYAEGNKIVDDAWLLESVEVQQLEEKARSIADEYGMDVVILTVDSTDGMSIRDYADDYYDNNGYGIGADYSGVLFMLAMDTREWYISTCGDGIYAVTDFGVQMLFSEIAAYLSEGDYYTAFDTYLSELERYYDEYVNGMPVDGYAPEYEGPGSYEPDYDQEVIYPEPERRIRYGGVIFSSLLIGLIIAAVALWIMKIGMKTARRQSGASGYLTNNVHIGRHQDFFLYSRTSRTAKPQNNGGGRSRSGGGSRVHRSSSGRRHGGGGGRF